MRTKALPRLATSRIEAMLPILRARRALRVQQRERYNNEVKVSVYNFFFPLSSPPARLKISGGTVRLGGLILNGN